VVGSVQVPEYDETVTAANIYERLDFYTHRLAPIQGINRKDFVAGVAEAVMHKLLDAPASQWEPLGQAVGRAFDAGQALAWSSDPQVAATLATRGWDGAFPPMPGDFFFNGEFEYAAKNGRALKRVYDHQVTVNPDGSARVTTTLTLTNTSPADQQLTLTGSLAYMTVYGPEGAALDAAASDAFGLREPSVAGHPGTGWFRGAPPSGGQTTLKIVWDVPNLVRQDGRGAWRYDLHWLHLPDHTGDVVNLQVDLPAAWRWKDGPPPGQLSLDQDVAGSWPLIGP
jgi:hypothetical protein